MNLDHWADLWDSVSGGWRAGDGCWSLQHPSSGDMIFTFGDTVISDGGLRTFPQSSAVLWRAGTDALELASYPDGWLPATRVSSEFRWPGPMVWDGGLGWVFGHRLERVSGGWGFRVLRKEAHAFEWPAGGWPLCIGTVELPSTRVNGTGILIEWGAGALALGEHLYVYGVVPAVFGGDVYLARVRPRDWMSGAGWEFRSGVGASAWSKDPARLYPVIPRAVGPDTTFSVSYENERVHIVSKLYGVFGDTITRWWAPDPTGPFSPYRDESVRVPWTREDMTYGARAHHALPRTDEGKLVVSVSHNFEGADLATLFRPDGWRRYRPSWHGIPIE